MPALKQPDTPNSAKMLSRAAASEMAVENLKNDSIKAVDSVPGMVIQRKPVVQKRPGADDELPMQRKFFNTGVSPSLQVFQPGQRKEQTFDINTASGRSNKMPFIQAKLTINAPGDQYEQEADSMADKVMRMPANGLPFSPSSSSITPIQRKCSDCEDDEKVHRKETSSQPVEAGNDVSSYVSSLSSKGSPMPGGAKSFFEQRFGRDFSDVKIHNDDVAAKSAQSINALAYTHGNNIVFNQNQFAPETDSGKRLLAHELTHVVQQNGFLNKMIQKANIAHRTLTWDDFKGPVANPSYDAGTVSDITYPDLTTIKPVIKEKMLDDDCEIKEDKKAAVKMKKTEATIGLNSGGIKVSSFMNQEKSWVKPELKNIAGMKRYCAIDQKTSEAISDCTSSCKTGNTNAPVKCTPLLDSCKKTIKEGNILTWKSITADSDTGCDQIFEACKKEQIDAIKFTTGKGKKVSAEGSCSPTVLAECLEVRQEVSTDVLSHEQGHFDITDVIAKKLEADVKSIVDGVAKKIITGCGHSEAQKIANDVVVKEVNPQINNKIKEAQDKVNEIKGYFDPAQKKDIKGKLKETQGKYDTETTHGEEPEKQHDWKKNILEGSI